VYLVLIREPAITCPIIPDLPTLYFKYQDTKILMCNDEIGLTITRTVAEIAVLPRYLMENHKWVRELPLEGVVQNLLRMTFGVRAQTIRYHTNHTDPPFTLS